MNLIYTNMILPINYTESHWSIRKQARLQYIREQDNKCHFCKCDIHEEPKWEKSINKSLFPIYFFDHPIHLHHCHETEMTIGAVHAYCNAVLWQYHNE